MQRNHKPIQEQEETDEYQSGGETEVEDKSPFIPREGIETTHNNRNPIDQTQQNEVELPTEKSFSAQQDHDALDRIYNNMEDYKTDLDELIGNSQRKQQETEAKLMDERRARRELEKRLKKLEISTAQRKLAEKAQWPDDDDILEPEVKRKPKVVPSPIKTQSVSFSVDPRTVSQDVKSIPSLVPTNRISPAYTTSQVFGMPPNHVSSNPTQMPRIPYGNTNQNSMNHTTALPASSAKMSTRSVFGQENVLPSHPNSVPTNLQSTIDRNTIYNSLNTTLPTSSVKMNSNYAFGTTTNVLPTTTAYVPPNPNPIRSPPYIQRSNPEIHGEFPITDAPVPSAVLPGAYPAYPMSGIHAAYPSYLQYLPSDLKFKEAPMLQSHQDESWGYRMFHYIMAKRTEGWNEREIISAINYGTNNKCQGIMSYTYHNADQYFEDVLNLIGQTLDTSNNWETLGNIKQEKKESVTEFNNRFMNLFGTTVGLPLKLVADYYMKGLKIEIRDELEKLVLDNPDLTTLRKKALKLEKILKERSKRVEVNNFISDSEDSEEINHADRRRAPERRREYEPRQPVYEPRRDQDYRRQEQSRRDNDDRYYEQRRSRVVCFNCRKPGHYSTECTLQSNRTDRRPPPSSEQRDNGQRRDTGNNNNSNNNRTNSSNQSNSVSGPRSA